MYRTNKAVLLLGVAVMLALTGCGKLTDKGEFPPNNPPRIFFANIPVDSTMFSINPTLYWYGTDNDGTIEQYQYSVKKDTTIVDWLKEQGIPLTAPRPQLFIEHAKENEDFDWVTIWVDSVQTSTRDQIRLYASFDTNYVVLVDETCDPPCTTYLIDCDVDSVGYEIIGLDTISVDPLEVDTTMMVLKDTLNCISTSIQQYMFIRAIDDDDAASTIKYRQYLRNNHWPQTKIENAIEFSRKVYFNDTIPTVTFPGIPITWAGSDSADYPRQQPDFEYWWRVFGPFADSAGAVAAADTVLVDTVLANSLLAYDSGDSMTVDGWARREEGVWVTRKSTELIDLWREVDKIAPSDTTRVGYFLFEVRTRDDAFAEDPTPSWVTFKAIDAKMEHQILFIDDVNYRGNQEPLSPIGSGADGKIDKTLLRERIFRILEDATDGAISMDATSGGYYRRANGYGSDHEHVDIPLDTLARYRLVLIVDDDALTPVEASEKIRLAEYMNIGGNVWIFGRNSLLAGSGNPYSITEPTVFPAGPFASFYFDAERLYFVIWSRQAYKIVEGRYVFTEGIDDFIGAEPTEKMAGVFPALAVDTNLTKDFWVPAGMRNLFGFKDFRFYTIPDANFIEKGTAAEAIYTYDSRYAGAGFPHDKVCAIRYIGPSRFNPVFKSALFAFSPYAIQHAEIVEVFREMLAWFEEGST